MAVRTVKAVQVGKAVEVESQQRAGSDNQRTAVANAESAPPGRRHYRPEAIMGDL